MDISRRQALAAMGIFGAGFGLSGCSIPITPFCPTDPTISDPRTPLTIDVHAHVFNGSDLQIEGFLKKILARDDPDTYKEAAELLAELGRNFAPSAAQELAELQRIDATLRSCSTNGVMQVLNDEREAGYRRARRDLQIAVQSIRSRKGRFASSPLRRQIENLPESYSQYKKLGSEARFALRRVTADGALQFLIRSFQYRYVNVYEYLLEYSRGKTRKVDVLVTHLVDYDWPIGDGIPTPTSLNDQVRVMERISQVTGGRVLCFAPFDPFKEIAAGSSLAFVTDAVMNHGFVGVKLYPPMGFAPLGNAAFPDSFWNDSALPPNFPRTKLGQNLDQVLVALYSWCQTNGVPIMAHTSASNGPALKFDRLTYAEYWGNVARAFPALRVDFGHFGVTSLASAAQPDALADLMPDGEYLYADSGYFSEVLSEQAKLEAYLAARMRRTSTRGPAAVAQRLMYGTDWEMVVLEGFMSGHYLARFEAMYGRLDRDKSLGADGLLSDRFFGINAARFLGLGIGQPNRRRLDQYYSLSSKPAWMAKVDSLPAWAI
ncbi:amidohydrolase family protein [Bradyrhizobium sp.]|uniref:amidohydrolase family protein n=1 Tax=Bradyrhizobium sp. TaxID=376 RepID=UPI002C18E790|nr:amidohydrolase family protein [Bradyrhizobium sp.]HMM90753.1 amidohydrolase family protein [Bradyrhizobium sp.]